MPSHSLLLSCIKKIRIVWLLRLLFLNTKSNDRYKNHFARSLNLILNNLRIHYVDYIRNTLHVRVATSMKGKQESIVLKICYITIIQQFHIFQITLHKSQWSKSKNGARHAIGPKKSGNGTYLDLHGRERVSDNGQKVGKEKKHQDIISDKTPKILQTKLGSQMTFIQTVKTVRAWNNLVKKN